jgi:hypothetical protein
MFSSLFSRCGDKMREYFPIISKLLYILPFSLLLAAGSMYSSRICSPPGLFLVLSFCGSPRYFPSPFLSTNLFPFLSLAILLSAIFYALDLISRSHNPKKLAIVLFSIPLLLSICGSILLIPWFSGPPSPSLFLAGYFNLIIYGVVFLYISSVLFVIRLLPGKWEEIGSMQVAYLILISFIIWFLFFNPISLLLLNTIPSVVALLPPFLEVKKPMEIMKGAVVYSQLVSIAFLWVFPTLIRLYGPSTI